MISIVIARTPSVEWWQQHSAFFAHSLLALVVVDRDDDNKHHYDRNCIDDDVNASAAIECCAELCVAANFDDVACRFGARC